MAFYFNNKFSVDIEGKEYNVDLSTNQAIEAVKTVRDKSLELAKKESNTFEELVEYTQSLKKFTQDLLGGDACKEIFKDKEYGFEDMAELTQYLLSEIDKFKSNKMKTFSHKYTPEKLN